VRTPGGINVLFARDLESEDLAFRVVAIDRPETPLSERWHQFISDRCLWFYVEQDGIKVGR
jgi:hypothetical protein